MQHADRSTASLVEIFRNMQMDEEEPLENGDLDYEVEVNLFPICWIFFSILFMTLYNTCNRKTIFY